MNAKNDVPQNYILPFKSIAVALLFSVFLGPVGLLYATTLGGIVMLILGVIVGCLKLGFLMFIVWVSSCVWAVFATNRYNERLCKKN